MNRRSLLRSGALLALGAGLAAARAQEAAKPTYRVSAAQLQEVVAQRFPQDVPLGNLFAITVQAPRIRLLPKSNRLGTELALEAGGPALHRRYPGTFDVEFGLRYEDSDQTIRAHSPSVNALRFEGAPPQVAQLLEQYGPSLARQAMDGAVLHKLRPQDLMMADGLGLQPGNITVTASGLVIHFVPKRAP